MRKALVVGIDEYPSSMLFGCVNDSCNVKKVLERHSDGTVNFGVEHIAAARGSAGVSKSFLRSKIQELFSDDSEIALFYFAGHGLTECGNGYILASDFRAAGDGIPLNDVMSWVNRSRAKNKIIILDSCYSGLAGQSETNSDFAAISKGTTILTASSENQYAAETNGSGVFTTLLVDALEGAAGNLVGDVSPGGIYAHIDQSLGAWQQRPLFKTNVKNFVSLRKVQAPIALSELQLIVIFLGLSIILCNRLFYWAGNLSSNWMAKQFKADFQSLTGSVHFWLMLRSASQKILKTASSCGKAPLALVTLRRLIFKDSMALVV